MQKIILSVWFCAVSFVGIAQALPSWLNENQRVQQYSSEDFITGSSEFFVESGKTPNDYIERAKNDAQADLARKIRVRIQSTIQSNVATLNSNGRYSESESFTSQSSTQADAEITGIKTETHFDPTTNIVYAFAYVNRYELIGYYKSNLSVNIGQIESFAKTAQDLEANGEKAKARQQIENAQAIFLKIRYAQDILTALDSRISNVDLQQEKSETLYNTLTQMQARLAQAVYVYIESSEDLFGQKVFIVANKLKAELANKGCSFVENSEQADFKLKIDVSTRYSSSYNNLVFCYADTYVELHDIRKQKVMYSDIIAQRSGGVSEDRAGRKAMEDVVPKISKQLNPWIEN